MTAGISLQIQGEDLV